jgi:PBP1b-binding outer membrane lipoprotein LpoB
MWKPGNPVGKIVGLALLASAMGLTGCAAALSEDEACIEARAYVGSVTSTIQRMTSAVQDNDVVLLNKILDSMEEDASEFGTLRIGNPKMEAAVQQQSKGILGVVAASRKLGEASLAAGAGDSWGKEVSLAYEDFEAGGQDLVRICDF